MKIEHLCYLQEIAKCKSITAAAKRLYVGQTTLSAIVKSIEDELDVRIFRRVPSGVVPTEDGIKILDLSKEIIDRYNEMLSCYQPGSIPEKRVHFAGNTTICQYFSVYLTKVIQNVSDQASIIFHSVDRRKVLPMLLDGVSNLGATTLDIDAEVESFQTQAAKNGIETVQIGTDKFYLCVRSDREHFSGREFVDISELEGERYVAPQYYSVVPNGTAFSDAFRKLNCVATLPTPGLVLKAVMECDMITILMGRSLVDDPHIRSGELLAIPLTGFSRPNSTGTYLFSRKRSSLNYFEKAIYDALTSCGNQVIDPKNSSDNQYPPIVSLNEY